MRCRSWEGISAAITSFEELIFQVLGRCGHFLFWCIMFDIIKCGHNESFVHLVSF